MSKVGEKKGVLASGTFIVATAFLVLVCSIGLRLFYLNAPLADGDSRGEAVEAINYYIARNTFWYGFGATNGLQVRNHQQAEPQQWCYYNNHPATFTILAGLSFKIAGGPDMAILRLLPFCAFLVQLLLIYRLARRRGGRVGPWVAAAVYSIFPMTLFFANHANYEAYVLVSMMLFVDRVLERKWGQAVLVTFLGGLVDFVGCFPAVLFAPWLLVKGWKKFGLSPGQALGVGVGLAGACLVALTIHFTHVAMAPGDEGFLAYLKGVALASNTLASALGFTWGGFAVSQVGFLLSGFCISGFILALVGFFRRPVSPGTGLLLSTGAFYIFIFRYHAHVHEFWGIYLAPGLALCVASLLDLRPPGWFRRQPVIWSTVTLLLLATIAVEGIWRYSNHRAEVDYEKPERWAESLKNIFEPEKTVVVMTGSGYPPFWGVEVNTKHLSVRTNSLIGPRDLVELANILKKFSLFERQVVVVVSEKEARRHGEDVFKLFRSFIEQGVAQGDSLGLLQPDNKTRKDLPSFYAWDISAAVQLAGKDE